MTFILFVTVRIFVTVLHNSMICNKELTIKSSSSSCSNDGHTGTPFTIQHRSDNCIVTPHVARLCKAGTDFYKLEVNYKCFH